MNRKKPFPFPPERYLERLQQESFISRNGKLTHVLESVVRNNGSDGAKEAALLLFKLARSTGVVGPGLLEPYQFVTGPGDRELGWCHNPNRGNPITTPPNLLGFEELNRGCYLDLRNIAAQNHAEPVFTRRPAWSSRTYNVLPQVRPFSPEEGVHLVLATDQHLPQGYDSPQSLVALLGDLVGWACEFPGWVIGYNSPEAAASNLHHRHFQVLQCGTLPLFRAARLALKRGGSPAVVLDYPIAAVAISGNPVTVRQQVRALLPDLFHATTAASILAQRDGDDVLLVYVPRTPSRESIAVPVSSRAGFLEVGGVLLVKSPHDKDAIVRAPSPYQLIHDALRSLEPDGIRVVLAACRARLATGTLSFDE